VDGEKPAAPHPATDPRAAHAEREQLLSAGVSLLLRGGLGDFARQVINISHTLKRA
jgi:hypothetical protein